MDQLGQMRIFRHVVDSGSLTGAARTLGISVPVVSREVARLEKRVGQPLLVRTTRSMALNEAGQRYYEQAVRILGQVDELDASMQDLAGAPAGELRVSVSEVLGYLKLTPVLAEFQARYPRIALSVSYSDRNVDLVGERFDCAIRMGPLHDSSLRATRLMESRGVFCAAPDYIARHGAPHKPGDLADHQLLGFLDGSATLPWYVRVGGKVQRVVVQASLRVDQALSYVALMKSGCGIGLAFDWMVEGELARGELARVLKDCPAGYSPQFPETVYLVRPPSRHEAMKVKLFSDFLRQRFAARR